MVDSEEFLSRMLQSSHSAYNFVIADRGDERYIGQLDMFQVDWRLRCGDLGMVIGSASDRDVYKRQDLSGARRQIAACVRERAVV